MPCCAALHVECMSSFSHVVCLSVRLLVCLSLCLCSLAFPFVSIDLFSCAYVCPALRIFATRVTPLTSSYCVLRAAVLCCCMHNGLCIGSTSHVYRTQSLNGWYSSELFPLSGALAKLVPFLPSHCEHLFQLCVSNLTNLGGEVSLRFSLSLTHTHTSTHAHTCTHTSTHTHSLILSEAHCRSCVHVCGWPVITFASFLSLWAFLLLF